LQKELIAPRPTRSASRSITGHPDARQPWPAAPAPPPEVSDVATPILQTALDAVNAHRTKRPWATTRWRRWATMAAGSPCPDPSVLSQPPRGTAPWPSQHSHADQPAGEARIARQFEGRSRSLPPHQAAPPARNVSKFRPRHHHPGDNSSDVNVARQLQDGLGP